jgi:hypothetical protein
VLFVRSRSVTRGTAGFLGSALHSKGSRVRSVRRVTTDGLACACVAEQFTERRWLRPWLRPYEPRKSSPPDDFAPLTSYAIEWFSLRCAPTTDYELGDRACHPLERRSGPTTLRHRDRRLRSAHRVASIRPGRGLLHDDLNPNARTVEQAVTHSVPRRVVVARYRDTRVDRVS